MATKKGGPVQPIQVPVTQQILDIAEQLAQTRGFNGFSYADIAAQLQLTKPSIHYHFPNKADLGRALIARYRVVFAAALDGIDRQARGARDKLRRYIGLYESVMRNNRMCLCGMLAAEYATLPQPMQDELRRFFDVNEVWLTSVLDDGRHWGELTFEGPSRQRARNVLGALEGAMLVARAYEDSRRFASAAKQLIADLSAARGENGNVLPVGKAADIKF